MKQKPNNQDVLYHCHTLPQLRHVGFTEQLSLLNEEVFITNVRITLSGNIRSMVRDVDYPLSDQYRVYVGCGA